ncbi:MAG: L-histidine N(alpha)-methyltransferase [Streptosporangiales bacterium]|nr:L-histidine N(alpha)-methyltransferase [Streptosporangiales bacterium]
MNDSTATVTVSRYLTDEHSTAALADDVRSGLTGRPKVLPPKHFYDARGSELFEYITRLPEYYPTRAERTILEEHAVEIARLSAADTVVELGSGSSAKTRLLLDGLRSADGLRRYIPVDVSESALVDAVRALHGEYPELTMHGVVADFAQQLHLLPREGNRLLAFLGGTIGNLTPAERADFLRQTRAHLAPGETLLLGTDLVKDTTRLLAAYDDAAGVTAQFNKNVLHVINRELDGHFDPETFTHVAAWDEELEQVEMRLRSTTDQTVPIDDLDLVVPFAAGEEMRTEISAKFRKERVAAELRSAGMTLAQWWTDPAGDFAVSLSVAT